MNPKRPSYDRDLHPTGRKVSPERLEEFRRLCKKAFNEEITPQEAVRSR
jgi:hypothetical protein